MLSTLLIVTGGAFGLTVIGGAIAAVVKRVRNNRNVEDNSTPAPTPAPAKKKVNRLTVGKVREELQNRINEVTKMNENIDEIIANKVETLELKPNTHEHKAFVAAAIKRRWERTSSAYVKKVTGVMEGLTDKSNFEEVLEKNKFPSEEEFVNKCVKSVVPLVSEKYAFYATHKKVMSESLDMKKKENRHAKLIASKNMIDSLHNEVKNMVINDTKVEDFKVEAAAKFETIKNEEENVRQFRKTRNALQTSLSSISKLDKKTASKEEVNEKINEIAKAVNAYRKKTNIDLQDLKLVKESLEKLQKDFGSLDKGLEDKLKKFRNSIVKMTEVKISEIVKNKADRSDLNEHMAEVRGLIDGFKETLKLVDLAGLAVKIEDLTKAYQEVYGHIDDVVKKEIDDMKNSINKGISVRIGVQLKKKLVGFDDKQIQQIVAKSVEEAKKIVPVAVEEKLSEEAFADRVIEALNTKIVVGKK